MKTSLNICDKDFYITGCIKGRSYKGFDVRCKNIELIGILHDDECHFLKLWGNGKIKFDEEGMDCAYDMDFHRLLIVGVDEV